MRHSDKGHLAEAFAEAWLISKGYWVFKNRAPQGPIDMIAIHQKTGKQILIDVKTVSRYKDGSIRSRIVSAKARELGVQLLYVDLEKGTCRIVKRRKDWMKKHSKTQYYGKEEFTKISHN